MSARLSRSRPVRCVIRPMPVAAKEISPGCCLARAIRLRQRFDAGLRVGANEHRLVHQRADRKKITRQDQGKVLCLAGHGNEQRKRRREQRITVRDRLGRCVGRDGPAGARLIDRHDLLAPQTAEPIHHHPECDVNGTAGRGIGNDPDGFVRVVVRLRRRYCGGRERQKTQRHHLERRLHACSSEVALALCQRSSPNGIPRALFAKVRACATH